MTENELKRLIVDLAHEHDWNVFHTSQSKPRRPVRVQGRSSAPGYPDLTLARGQRVVFMELKTETGIVSDDQWRWCVALPDWYVIRPSDWSSGRVAGLLD